VCSRPDVNRFHFLDETGLRLDYARTHARAVGGQRVGGAVPLRRGPALTLIGALSVQGLGAVQLLQGALNQRGFAFYVAYCLAPTLRPGDVLVLDNLPVHHLTGLRAWLAKRGVELVFLPPYSPDFTPIEQAWSKLRAFLRLVYVVATVAKPVFGILLGYPVGSGLDDAFQRLSGAGLGRAQPG
ncbi:IS630 family transposase, partial [Hymenobacter algoricola]|uniref:IS630 family transposase n=1 Tax=Hymenobacter algoricola TaxID=486267 RepID=UPI0031F07436